MLVPPIESDVGLGTAFVSGGGGTKGLLQFDGGTMSSAPSVRRVRGALSLQTAELDVHTGPERVELCIESDRSTRDLDDRLSIALRKPCIQANEAVTFSVTWNDTPRVSVFWMIPGAWALKSVVTARIGLVL